MRRMLSTNRRSIRTRAEPPRVAIPVETPSREHSSIDGTPLVEEPQRSWSMPDSPGILSLVARLWRRVRCARSQRRAGDAGHEGAANHDCRAHAARSSEQTVAPSAQPQAAQRRRWRPAIPRPRTPRPAPTAPRPRPRVAADRRAHHWIDHDQIDAAERGGHGQWPVARSDAAGARELDVWLLHDPSCSRAMWPRGRRALERARPPDSNDSRARAAAGAPRRRRGRAAAAELAAGAATPETSGRSFTARSTSIAAARRTRDHRRQARRRRR